MAMPLRSCSSALALVLLSFVSANGGPADGATRRLSYSKIVGYEPASDVTQHSLIDLDQQEFESHLAASAFSQAKEIYNRGGNSGGH